MAYDQFRIVGEVYGGGFANSQNPNYTNLEIIWMGPLQ
jgi:hypothetical protein